MSVNNKTIAASSSSCAESSAAPFSSLGDGATVSDVGGGCATVMALMRAVVLPVGAADVLVASKVVVFCCSATVDAAVVDATAEVLLASVALDDEVGTPGERMFEKAGPRTRKGVGDGVGAGVNRISTPPSPGKGMFDMRMRF